jgi:DNA-binding NtrC family response regulator
LLTALIVGPDVDSRADVATLLRLTGWEAREAYGIGDALLQAEESDPDLVVTDSRLDEGPGTVLLRRLRGCGSQARFLMVADVATPELCADAAHAGALACLTKPVDERLLLGFLRSRTTGPTAQGNFALDDAALDIRELEDLHDADVDEELMDRLQEMYASALPARMSAIALGARSGDAPALFSAAQTLAGTSGQLGHPEVASVCQAIAADARRGILAHSRLVQLRDLARA